MGHFGGIMANSYCATSDLKAYPELGLASTTDYDAIITDDIEVASRLIDREIGKWPGFFYPTTDDVTRYYDGNGEQELDIDPYVSITSVSVSEEGNYSSSDYTAWTLGTDYYTWPYNSTSLEEPVVRLIVDHNGDKLNWTRFKKAVQVIGVAGYSAATPAVIKKACVIQVFRWYMRGKQGYADGGANVEIGRMVYVKQLDPDIKELLRSFMAGL